MAETLTPAQRSAVSNRGGKLLVSAAAGSGKTKVLVDRLMSYLMNPVDPANLDEFLIITYTQAAAAELRAKIANKLTEHIAADPENRHLQKQLQRLYLAKISTVHGFCSDILKEYAYRLDLDADFRVADESISLQLQDQALQEILDSAYEKLGEEPDFRAFVDTQGLGRSDRALPELITQVYASAQCHPDPDKWLDGCMEQALPAVEDAGETQWGKSLMEELMLWLDGQIAALTRCCQTAGEAGMDKVADNLAETLAQLQYLRESRTWDQVHTRIQVNFGTLRFPTKGVDSSRTEEIKAVRAACKKELEKQQKVFGRDSASLLADLMQLSQAQRGLVSLVKQFSLAYAEQKKKRRLLDFGDLEHKALDLLVGPERTGPTAAAKEIGRRFREVMVDEYQDSNGVQDAIFESLTMERQNCFLVGDVKQSIYQFRLADPGIFLEKYKTFLPAEIAQPGQGRKVLLSHNFRSGGEIVEAVNHVFAHCMSPQVGGLYYGQEEALREGIPHEPLPDTAVELYAMETGQDSGQEEADFVAARISEMLRAGSPIRDGEKTRGVTEDDIVILLRSPGSVGEDFRIALEKRGIRCATGAGADLLRTPEICTLRAILQTVANPRQDIPLLSALASPAFGFTAENLAQIRSTGKKGCIYDAIIRSDHPKARAFLKTLEGLRAKARMSSLTELLEHIFLLTGLDEIYAARDGGNGAKENLRTFFQMAVEYEQGNLSSLEQFLEYLDDQAERGILRPGAAQTGAVTIMSIHKSKGLEFPVVFLSALSRKFNRKSLNQQILCDQEMGLGLNVADQTNRVRYPSLARLAIARKMTREAVSEEMRILYVAMTRARDRLIMTYASKKCGDTIKGLAQRMNLSGMEMLCAQAQCPGQWILLAALLRTESGQLRGLTGVTLEGTVSDTPWKIRFVEAPEEQPSAVFSKEQETAAMPEGAPGYLRKMLAYRYPFEAATHAPSKQTATGRKGREKDQEAAQDAPEEKEIRRLWRQPAFGENKKDGRAYGNAMHRAMQYLHFEACGSLRGVREEIARMKSEEILTAQEAQMIDCDAIARFFESDVGWRLRVGNSVLREFKFSVLDNGEKYGPGLEGEQVLLQGVVDCALVEPDGITIVDFKTDRVSESQLPQAVERYRLQVETYKEAMERIFETDVKKCLLYFFHLGAFAEV